MCMYCYALLYLFIVYNFHYITAVCWCFLLLLDTEAFFGIFVIGWEHSAVMIQEQRNKWAPFDGIDFFAAHFIMFSAMTSQSHCAVFLEIRYFQTLDPVADTVVLA